jgi:hypothetical protein
VTLLQQAEGALGAAWLLPLMRALQTIVAGNRDRALADAPELHYSMAVEILFLIETLEAPRPGTDEPPPDVEPGLSSV